MKSPDPIAWTGEAAPRSVAKRKGPGWLLVWLLLIPIVCAACQGRSSSTPDATGAASVEQVRRLLGALDEARRDGDPSPFEVYLHPEIEILPPGENLLWGEEAAARWLERSVTRLPPLEVPGDAVGESGRRAVFLVWSAAAPRRGPSAERAEMRVLAVVMRGDDGRWRLRRLVWNESAELRVAPEAGSGR